MTTTTTVDIGKTHDLLAEVEGAVYDELDKHGYVEDGYLTVTLKYSKNPTSKIKYCKCGSRGIALVGENWYCYECYDNGDDEDHGGHG